MPTAHATTQRPGLSLVVPVFNGARFVADSLRALDAHFGDRGGAVELIVVDDGSRDDTLERIRAAAPALRVPIRVLRHRTNLGKGAAVASGVAAARGDRIVFLDADLAYPPGEVDAIVAALAAGADVAVASRVHRTSRYVVRPAFFRYVYLRHVAGRLFNWLVRLVLLPGLHDTQAGLKGFTAQAAARLFAAPLPRGFAFDLGLLMRARRLRCTLREVGVCYRYEDEPTTVRFVHDTLAVLREMGRLRLAALTPAVLVTVAAVNLVVLVVARLVLVNGVLAILAWIAAGAALALLARAARPPAPRIRWFRTRGEALAFIAILVIGAALRLVRLDDVPPMVHLDSAECGLRGLALLRGGVADPFDFSPWYRTPYLSFLPYAASFAGLGVSVVGLRLPSALLGTLCLVALYAFARVWLGARAALLATALFAVSHAAIHFSRIGLWNVQVLFYALTAFALLAAGWRRDRPLAIYGAGVTAGLALYSYTAGRLIVLVVAAFLVMQALAAARRRRAGRLAGWFALGVAIAGLPLLLNYVKEPEVLHEDRSAAVWVLAEENAPHVAATLGTTEPAAVLWKQLVLTLQGFITLGDTSSQYGTSQPLLSPVVALLALLGFAVAVRRAGRPAHLLLLLWSGFGVLLGSVLILDPPSYTRLIILFPVPYLLAAVALLAVLRRVGWGRRREAFVAGCAAVAVVAALFNLNGYARFLEAMRQMPREWDVLRVMERAGPDVDYYLFTGPFLLGDSPIFQLFADGARTVSGFTEQDLPERLARDAVFVLQGDVGGLGMAISERFPDAQREVIRDEDGHRKLVLYRCEKEEGCQSAVN